ncbi:MAG: hypothetical protein QME63_01885 [Actinomycetota bacterium]|nr:hypothetical protein [Actinomycetota bacterium]
MLDLGEQQITSTQDQVFVSCKSCGYRQNIKAWELADPLRIICNGPDCGDTYSIKEGIKNAITSDNDFMAWCFVSDTIISGHDTIVIGTVKEIKLKIPIRNAKKVFILQTAPLEADSHSRIYLEHKIILPDILLIISSGDSVTSGKPCDINWVVYADVKSDSEEAWREYLQRAKESIINGNYQGAIIEAEIAVEVTLATVLWDLLTRKKKLSDDVVDWILSKVQAASDRAKKVMELAIGKKISDINPGVYKSWVKLVAQKRNRIVHRGEPATREEAIDAIGAAFEIIWLLLELADKEPVGSRNRDKR